MRKVLFIQTAFIGDAILATGVLEAWHAAFPEDEIHYVVRKGNNGLFAEHPFIKKLYVWDKQGGKYKDLIRIWKEVKTEQYDLLFNLQRFGATGLLAGFSKAKQIIGFDKNPFSFLFNEKHPHNIGNGTHEVERNHLLLSSFIQSDYHRPKLYPRSSDFEAVKKYQSEPYICMAPTSVWFTKQLPPNKWVELINELADRYQIYLLGAPSDESACNQIIEQSITTKITNLAGKLNLLQSTALMNGAAMNYTNDSAPMHLASAINAPTTAIFCSTIPNFGFGPLADENHVVETQESLPCRPCGLHGKKVCPKQHFNCAQSIKVSQLTGTLTK
jgi:heptosyltransferase-2